MAGFRSRSSTFGDRRLRHRCRQQYLRFGSGRKRGMYPAARLCAQRGRRAHGHIHRHRQRSNVTEGPPVDRHRHRLRTERERKHHSDDLRRLRSGVPVAPLLGGRRAGNGRVFLFVDTGPCNLPGEPGNGSSGAILLSPSRLQPAWPVRPALAAASRQAASDLARNTAASGAAWVGPSQRTAAARARHAVLRFAGLGMRHYASDSVDGLTRRPLDAGHADAERNL